MNGPLQVLVVAINYAPEPTGIGPYTTAMVRGLRLRGHGVRVLTAFPHYPAWRVGEGYSGLRRGEQLDGVPVARLRHYVPSRPTGVRRAASELSFGLHAVVGRWGHPDVVLSTSPALLSAALVQVRSRAAFGLQIQDLYSVGISEMGGSSAVRSALTAIERHVVRTATGVAVIHNRFKSRVVGDLGVSEDRVAVIRNWTHVRPHQDVDAAVARRAHGWGEDFVILHAGAMGEKQGLRNVIEAARVAGARGMPFRFVLLGDGSQRRALETAALGVRTVQFIDPLPDREYLEAMRAADVLLVNERPGVADMAVPSKLTSYFVAARPVVAATGASSTTAEEIAASGAGLRVEPGNPDALVRALESLRVDAARRASLARRGPVYCDKVLSETAALDAYDEWVRELAERHKAT